MKTLDGLMRFLIVRMSGVEYMALVRRAGWHGMTLREYVGRRFEQLQARRAA